MDGMYKEQRGRLIFYRWLIFEPWRHRLNAALTTRHGGLSSPPLTGLNLGHQINDDHLQKNKNLVANALGVPYGMWAMCNQVHGVRITFLSGSEKPPFDSCDAVIVDKPNCITGVLLADCHPIMLYDTARHVAGVAHAGWRGTLAGIPRILVEQMVMGGSRLTDILAVAGPGIGPCCYTVGHEVASWFLEEFNNSGEFLSRNEHQDSWQLNLEDINIHILTKAGIPVCQIGRGGFCTACRGHDFFSYRKENGKTGRQAALMVLH